MKVFIVILHYGAVETTQKCIASIFNVEKHFEKIIIINNDQNIKLSERTFHQSTKKVQVINSDKNLGFAAGVNVGIKKALEQKADAVLLVNNDTVLEKSILDFLITVLKKEKNAGIFGPVITYNKNGKLLYDLGGSINYLFGKTSHTEKEMVDKNDPRQVTYISGCCTLIKKEVFHEIGFFDEQFFLYYEDVDFTLRASQKGFLSYVTPNAIIYHELTKAVGKLSPISVYHQTRSGILFGKKYAKSKTLNFGFLFLQSCLFFVKDKKAGVAAFNGLFDGLRKY